MTAQDVRAWIAELREKAGAPKDLGMRIDFYRAVLSAISENPINPSPTRATAEAALELL